MNTNLHVHETLRCVVASQAQMLSHSGGWKYVVLGQHLIGHKVGGSAIQLVFYVLLRVLSQTHQESILLFGVCLQDGIQGFSTEPLCAALLSALHCLAASRRGLCHGDR